MKTNTRFVLMPIEVEVDEEGRVTAATWPWLTTVEKAAKDSGFLHFEKAEAAYEFARQCVLAERRMRDVVDIVRIWKEGR